MWKELSNVDTRLKDSHAEADNMGQKETEIILAAGVIEKIKDIDSLPAHDEVIALMRFLGNDAVLEDCWNRFCKELQAYNVLNIEFVDALAEEIRKLGSSKTIEICAGNGKLSHHLKIRGIGIKPTDNNSWNLSNNGLVEIISHEDAMRKYNPKIVIGSWITPYWTHPFGYQTGHDVLDFPSVDYFVDIGENNSPSSWVQNEVRLRDDFRMLQIENPEKYAVGCTDTAYLGRIEHKSKVNLFERIKHQRE